VLEVDGPGVAAFDEETFGPVATITAARNEDDAVRLANATEFGLGLSVWSSDRARAAAFARRVTSGAAFINAMVASDPRVPFGGTKGSGFGRELASVGLREFVNTRTYWSAPSAGESRGDAPGT
jgi:acyl-CoA reductase-like NAD-dependent aldehyde dehydrogenase